MGGSPVLLWLERYRLRSQRPAQYRRYTGSDCLSGLWYGFSKLIGLPDLGFPLDIADVHVSPGQHMT